MAIHLLDNETIDKIAAGEVVERPLNVVKELIENSIDSGADRINVEIKDGGIELIRVTDNGSGIQDGEVEKAFLRHATSKLTTIEDLTRLCSLGFRGEALSSISAVSKVELITKKEDALLGSHVCVEGGKLIEHNEVGAPNGTTIIVRNLFYNTPVRRKFLKSAQTEASYVQDILEKMALSHPEISFSLKINNNDKLSTSGSGELKDVIYSLYGKDIHKALIKVDLMENGVHVSGFCASPNKVFGIRNNEIFFVNQRFVHSKLLNGAVEDVYKNYVMQHEFPFCVLFIDIDPVILDVNVHPQKMEVRFTESLLITDVISKAISEALKPKELIPEVSLDDKPKKSFFDFSFAGKPNDDVIVFPESETEPEEEHSEEAPFDEKTYIEKPIEIKKPEKAPLPFETNRISNIVKEELPEYKEETLFEKKLITDTNTKKYKIIGQAFDTYWFIQLDDTLYIVDQHAAHEKVNYERLLKKYQSGDEAMSQMIYPPMMLHLSALEEETLVSCMDVFEKVGFVIENFGQGSYAVREVPANLYGLNDYKELFTTLLNEIYEKGIVKEPTYILEKLASMSCKASVKGGQSISFLEMEHLMDEMMKLDNPYNCPHGRPTFIQISRYELEKKFHRIV